MKAFVFILSDPEPLQRLTVSLVRNHCLTFGFLSSSRHPDHYHFLQRRATNMAWAASPALQLAQLWGLQHLRGVHLTGPYLLFMMQRCKFPFIQKIFPCSIRDPCDDFGSFTFVLKYFWNTVQIFKGKSLRWSIYYFSCLCFASGHDKKPSSLIYNDAYCSHIFWSRFVEAVDQY